MHTSLHGAARLGTAFVLCLALLTLPASSAATATGRDAEPATTQTDSGRVAGPNRFGTAAAAAFAAFPDGAGTVVLANGEEWPDALSAAGLAGVFDAPVLLTSATVLPSETADALGVLGPAEVIVVGGVAAISERVAEETGQAAALLGDAGPAQVRRISGPDRIATAAAVAREITAQPGAVTDVGPSVILVTATDFADALAAGPIVHGLIVAGADPTPPQPLLLTQADTLSDTTADLLTDLDVAAVTIIGGDAAVGPSVAAQVEAQGIAVERVSAATRQGTAAAVASRLVPRASSAVLTRADEPADALAIAPFAALRGSPVLLTGSTTQLGSDAAATLGRLAQDNGVDVSITAAGGVAAVGPGVIRVAQSAGSTVGPTACAGRSAAATSDGERVGITLAVGVRPEAPTAADAVITDHHVGGVILAGRWRDGTQSVAQAVERLQGLASGGRPLLVMADQEGGQVQALQGPGFDQMPAAVEQGMMTPADLRESATRWGQQLAAARIDLDLAPVADVVPADVGTDNQPIGRFGRQYGDDPAKAAAHVVAFGEGLATSGVGVTVKHFPGLGRASGNTDTTGGVTDPTTANDPFLQPFRAAIDAGAPYVMVSSATYPSIDPDRRAVFSPIVIGDLLRGVRPAGDGEPDVVGPDSASIDGLGFDGVVMTDDVGAAVELRDVAVGDRAVRALTAGVDLVLTIDPGTIPAMAQALTERTLRDPGFAARVDDAALRNLRARVDAGDLVCAG